MAIRSSPSFSPSSSSFSFEFRYDVFLSFRGADTRFSFTGNLYQALCDRGIRTFIDDRELQGGDEITPTLVKAIEESMIFIPVFSHNYASSSFCLDELEHIIQCVKVKGRLVLPVFYGIEPSDVRHQTGSYGEAIATHEVRFQNKNRKYIHPIHICLILLLFAFLLYSCGFMVTFPLLLLFLLILHLQNKKENTDNMERLRKWKMALNHAANLSGRHYDLRYTYTSIHSLLFCLPIYILFL